MNEYIPSATALLVGLATYLIAVVLAAPLRRGMGKERADAVRITTCLRNLVGFLARPVFVLLLTQLVLWLLNYLPDYMVWIIEHPRHVQAWQLFWLGVLIIYAIEGVAHQIYVLRGRNFPIPDLLLSIIRVLLVLAMFFAVLRIELGINIAPLLASTALLTAVVGFALQGVLGNLLAGMSLHVVKSVVPGDWVRIDDIEGKITQTNWRETRLRTRAGHMLIVPNRKVSEALIHNMIRPSSLRRHAFHVGASYSDAPDEVIAALVEAARSVPEVLRHPAPDAFVLEYQDFGINYRLRFWTNQYFRRPEIEGDVGRMIWYKFKRRGIEIPFPMSDQLLNDFMAVVYHQRHLQPEQKELAASVSVLSSSDLCSKLCVDEDGNSLLSEEDLKQVAPVVRRFRYTHGETLFRQGEEGATFYVVAMGKLKGEIKHEKGLPPTLFELGPGAVLGEMSLMTGLPRTATIVVTESAELLEIDEAAFRQILAIHEDIPEILSRLVASRAAENAEALATVKELQAEVVEENIKQQNILARFLRLLGRS